MNREFGRRMWLSALTGIPFGIYKFGFGWFEFHQGHSLVGVAGMIWGVVDMGINLIAVPLPGRLSWCLLSNLGRLIDRGRGMKWEKVLLAIDTTAAFLIVSIMILLGRLPLEPPVIGALWNLAVVGNVMAVGLEQLYRAIRDRQ